MNKPETSWTRIIEDRKTGRLTALVTVGGSVITVVAYNWNWLMTILSTVFGIK